MPHPPLLTNTSHGQGAQGDLFAQSRAPGETKHRANQFGDIMSSGVLGVLRMAYALGAGLAFGGMRDFYKVFGWDRQPTHLKFVTKYITQDIAQRVINFPVASTWSDHPTVTGTTQFEKAWEDLVKQHDIYAHLARADIFAGLGAFSILLIGIDDGLDLSQPVQPGRKHRITYMQPYLEASLSITKLENNPNNPRFGLPVMYKVSPSNNPLNNRDSVTSAQRASFEVHYTRVLHLADNCLENIFVGHSRMRHIYNVLDDIQKVSGGSAETYWLTANRGLQVDIDKEMELDEDDANNMADEIDEYEHGVRRVLRTRGTKITNLGSDVADPRGVFNVLIALLSAATSIPQRVLIGAEAGQLASQQDRANWANTVAQRVANWGEPKVLKPFIKQLVFMGALPDPGKKLAIEWPEAFKMSPLERGQTSAQQARSITNVARAMETAQKGGYDLVSVEEAREMTAPGKSLLVLQGKPTGTFPPALSKPYNDPQNKLDEIEKQGEVDEAAAKAASERGDTQPNAFGNPAQSGGTNAAE